MKPAPRAFRSCRVRVGWNNDTKYSPAAQVERLVAAVELADATMVVVRRPATPPAGDEPAALAAPLGKVSVPRLVRLHGGGGDGVLAGFGGPTGRRTNVLVIGAGRVAASLVAYLGREPVTQVRAVTPSREHVCARLRADFTLYVLNSASPAQTKLGFAGGIAVPFKVGFEPAATHLPAISLARQQTVSTVTDSCMHCHRAYESARSPFFWIDMPICCAFHLEHPFIAGGGGLGAAGGGGGGGAAGAQRDPRGPLGAGRRRRARTPGTNICQCCCYLEASSMSTSPRSKLLCFVFVIR